MAKQKQSTGAPAPVVTAKPPKGAVRVLVRVRRTGRTMRMSASEARALHAINVVEYMAAPPPTFQAPTYTRRDMVAVKTSYAPIVVSVVATAPEVKKDDGEA